MPPSALILVLLSVLALVLSLLTITLAVPDTPAPADAAAPTEYRPICLLPSAMMETSFAAVTLLPSFRVAVEEPLKVVTTATGVTAAAAAPARAAAALFRAVLFLAAMVRPPVLELALWRTSALVPSRSFTAS